MKEALLQIKDDLGDNAMILKTRKIPRKMFALGEQAEIEVTAAVDDTTTSQPASFQPIKVSETGVYSHPKMQKKTAAAKPALPDALKPEAAQNREQIQIAPRAEALTEQFNLVELRGDIREMKELLASILATGESSAAGGFAGPWAILYKRLVDSEISAEIAEDLIHKLKNTTDTPEKSINKKFISVLAESFPVSGPLTLKMDGPLVVAMVGPTGSGKTTTIAKLAAYYSMNKNNVVSIITADTYRIAAIEQIRTFAEIVGIGVQVVFSPEEVADALAACENDDIVFVDTAGRSQRNTEHMRELETFLEALKPDETHLTMSATTKDSDLKDIIKRYKDLKINRLLITKLDETTKLGNVFNVVSKAGIAASYFTAGQSVPDDIELAQPVRFVQRLLEGSSL